MLKAKERPFFVGGQLADVFGGRAHALRGVAPRRPTLNTSAVGATAGGANAKGSYAELHSGIPDNAYGLHLILPNTGTARDTLADIAVGGAGSEVVVIANIFASAPKATFRYPLQGIWPIFIPKGSRIATRCQSTASGSGQEVWMIPFYVNPWPRIYRTVETYGAATGDSGGVSVDPGATPDTKGAYVQMVAATTRRIRLLTLVLGNQINAARTDCTWYFDIAVGGAGSEVIVLNDLRCVASSASDYANPTIYALLPVDIPAGSRIAVRAQCGTADATDRLIDAVLYGFAP